MKYILLLIAIVSSVFSANGQNSKGEGEIKGVIIDVSTGKGLEFATVSLLSLPDSTLVNGTVTNENGEFKLSSNRGKYIIKLQYISYLDHIQLVELTEGNSKIDLGKIELSPNTEKLDEVVVTGAKDQMQLELDKRIFNVGENPANIGANASEILDRIPSVAVDVEGNVSLRGSNNVRILVDGKPSGLVGINNTDGLRQLQGDLIERVEVVTNPSARYDAEGSAGIINIILKKQKKNGFNGSFTANAGFPFNAGFSSNVNYRHGKMNFFGGYGISYRENPGGGYVDRVAYGADTVLSYIDNDRVRQDLSHNIRLGADYNIDDKNILSVSSVLKFSDGENTTDVSYFDRDVNEQVTGYSLRKDTEKEQDDNYEYNLTYKHLFDNDGHELSGQFQYRDNNEIEDSSIGQANYLTLEPLEDYQRSVNEQVDNSTLIQVDYVNPLADGKKFEAGYRGTLREIGNDYSVTQKDSTGVYVPIEEVFAGLSLSNEFVYGEDVHAAYAIFENKMDKWGYQLGLRLEQSFITTTQRVGNENNKKDYLNAFPSAFVSYKLSKIRTVQASYSRRIERPRFWFLNPFYSFTDPRNIRRGNTDLNPSYTDSYEMGILNNLKNASLYFGGYYRYSTGIIERISVPGEFAGQPATITTPYNIGTEDAYGVEANFSYDPARWVNVNGNANFYRATTNGSYEGQELDRETITANFRLNTRLKFGKMNVQVSGNYRAPENTVQGSRKSFYSMDLGANMDVLKNKGTITLSVQDVLNSRKWRWTLDTPTLVETGEFQWRSRQMRVSFSYRINQKKQRPERESGYEGGGEDF